MSSFSSGSASAQNRRKSRCTESPAYRVNCPRAPAGNCVSQSARRLQNARRLSKLLAHSRLGISVQLHPLHNAVSHYCSAGRKFWRRLAIIWRVSATRSSTRFIGLMSQAPNDASLWRVFIKAHRSRIVRWLLFEQVIYAETTSCIAVT